MAAEGAARTVKGSRGSALAALRVLRAIRAREALQNIAATTLENVTAFESGQGTLHRVE